MLPSPSSSPWLKWSTKNEPLTNFPTSAQDWTSCWTWPMSNCCSCTASARGSTWKVPFSGSSIHLWAWERPRRSYPSIETPRWARVKDIGSLPEMVGDTVGMYNSKAYNRWKVSQRWQVTPWASCPAPWSAMQHQSAMAATHSSCSPPQLSLAIKDSCLVLGGGGRRKRRRRRR